MFERPGQIHTTGMNAVRSLLIGSALLLSLMYAGRVQGAEVEPMPPEIQAEAVRYLYTQERIAKRLVDACKEESHSFVEPGQLAVKAWQTRNASYMSLAPLLLDELRQAVAKAGQAEEWEMYEKEMLPLMMDISADTVVSAVTAAPHGIKRETKCTLVLGMINKGAFDIANSRADRPTLEFLDSRLRSARTR